MEVYLKNGLIRGESVAPYKYWMGAPGCELFELDDPEWREFYDARPKHLQLTVLVRVVESCDDRAPVGSVFFIPSERHHPEHEGVNETAFFYNEVLAEVREDARKPAPCASGDADAPHSVFGALGLGTGNVHGGC